MNTADLHPKRLPIDINVAQLRRLHSALQTLELSPHDQAAMPADRQLELDRAGEQVLTHLSMLVADTKDQADDAPITDSVPLLRAAAKVLLTACERCRAAALQQALASSDATRAAWRAEAQRFDQIMRQLAAQHGITSPLGAISQSLSPEQLAQLGLDSGALFACHHG